ncbi:molybdopterin molybdenumtransferase MoeA [Thermochromatium tepidum ATCC 43061]|uniref:Molybdopterin molybdenumtransferase n=2 Tax=Thermochromatium tepidum TaxID=1050 RepID=A0A6I6E6W3_THETI|nr:gephyrin-like molybdotransferase Glp [Thermochromatium tepidum]QGU33592.1 molybdopterin molybdenumtransferase MoeA [Thermochromatium tepidum ATCC 43061]
MMDRPNDCAPVATGGKTLTKDQAVAILTARVSPIAGTETLPLEAALGRVLAEPVVSTLDVPGWDNSAMDGYAIRHADLSAHDGCLAVAQRIPAGAVGKPLAPGTAARIFTGAPVPEGADTVVEQEVCEASDGQVRIPLEIKAGANIRRAGEDIRAGAEVIASGTRLTPAHLGLAASVGVARLVVHRRLRVALLSSGDELALPGEPLKPGQIYNSNRFVLMGLLQTWGCEVVDLGIVADDLESTVAAMARGAREADLIIASGGVSVGEEDHLKPAVERLGRIEFHQVKIRPGKPLVFGEVQGRPLLGCPGNPVSLFVTAVLFARPLILRMQGVAGELEVRPLRIRAGFDWPRPDRRLEFQRARLERGADGELEVAVYPSRSSAVLSSVAWADGLVQLQPGQVIARGDPVEFLPFAELFY